MSFAAQKLIKTIPLQMELGEGIIWHPKGDSLWWTDILNAKLYRLSWPTGELQAFDMADRVTAFAFIEGRIDVMFLCCATGTALFHITSHTHHWIDRPKELGDGLRLNDGRLGPAGRFWVGAMSEVGGADASLYRVDQFGQLEAMKHGIQISNGLCWSPDGKTGYFADSMKRTIYRANYDVQTGEFGEFEPFYKPERGTPDGAICDANGNLWVAIWGAGRVDILSPKGNKIGEILTDAPHTTCPALGGPAGNLLAVTTARVDLPEDKLADHPDSGSVLIYETTAKCQKQGYVKLDSSTLAKLDAKL